MRHYSLLGVVVLLFLLLSYHATCSQLGLPPARDGRVLAPSQKPIDLPLGSRQTKPKLSLQNALKIAEAYIVKEHIHASSYWLFQAKFILYGNKAGADKDKTPGWHFWWVNDGGAAGDYIEIFVSMDGKAMRLPSM
jgi:hypothetical protein